MKFYFFLLLFFLPMKTIQASNETINVEEIELSIDLASLMPLDETIRAGMENREPNFWPTISDHFHTKIVKFSRSKINAARQLDRKAHSLSLLYAWNAIWEIAWSVARSNTSSNMPTAWDIACSTFNLATLEVTRDSDWSAAWAFAKSDAEHVYRISLEEIAHLAHKDYYPELVRHNKSNSVVSALIDRQMMIYFYNNFDEIMEKIYFASYISIKQNNRMGNCNGFFSNYNKWERKNITDKLKDNPSARELLRPILRELKRINDEEPKNSCTIL